MGMKKTISLALAILIAYALCTTISASILTLWILIADWLRNDLGFSLFRTAYTMGMVAAIFAMFRAWPLITDKEDGV